MHELTEMACRHDSSLSFHIAKKTIDWNFKTFNLFNRFTLNIGYIFLLHFICSRWIMEKDTNVDIYLDIYIFILFSHIQRASFS